MKELTPEIIKILEQFTDPKEREEILKAFEDGWYGEGMDTGYPTKPEHLCKECKAVGFCERSNPARFKKELKKINRAYRMSDEEIKKLIPQEEKNVTWEIFGEYSTEHLQKAHEAFHQGDYETAMQHYKAILKKHNYEDRVQLYLAVCYYFMGSYKAAIDRAVKITASYTHIENFILHTTNKLRELKESGINKISEKQNQKEVAL